MKYGSVCSGIEAATVAWHPLGWEPAFFAEIEPFPCAVLQHHYPNVPNRGDITKFKEWPNDAIDLLVGGTPCQSFSVAGLRKGMADPRGNLALVFLAIADRLRPKWVVWENVPGVLSSAEGRDFGCFLGGLGELGYGFAYRVLDAQYFGVPQRRRRVFVVGHLGDWRRAAAVLFERSCLSGNPPPSRKQGERVAPSLDGRAGTNGQHTFNTSGGLIEGTPPLAKCLTAKGGVGRYAENGMLIAHALKGEGHDASEDGTGRGVPIVIQDVSSGTRHKKQHGIGVKKSEAIYTLDCRAKHAIQRQTGVRRLTPIECERLQGFPDNYTLVPYRRRPSADGPRYKALGNSMARPVMEWLGRRIVKVES